MNSKCEFTIMFTMLWIAAAAVNGAQDDKTNEQQPKENVIAYLLAEWQHFYTW